MRFIIPFGAASAPDMMGLFGPRGMALDLRERNAADLAAVLYSTVRGWMEATGQIVNMRGPAEFAAAITALRAKLAATARVLGIKPAP